jgi:biotin transport system substrate-specific component
MVRPVETLRSVSVVVPQVIAGSLLIALSAQLSVRLPLSPVPITAQTLAVLWVGALLGPTQGAASVLSYLAAGLMGLPVFASGSAGAAALLGPTGGYLVGFVAAAYITGWLFRHGWGTGIGSTAMALAMGNSMIYLIGVPWLSLFVGRQSAVAAGLTPFLLGDGLKLMMATAALALGPGWLRGMKE